MRDLRCQRVQCHEIWSFVGAKQKNVREEKRGAWGDLWTRTATAEMAHFSDETRQFVQYCSARRRSPLTQLRSPT